MLCYGKKGEVYNIGNTDPEISVSQIFKVLNKIHNEKILPNLLNIQNLIPAMNPKEDVQI